MKTIAYLAGHQAKNWLLNLRKKPGMLILYVFLLAVVIGLMVVPYERSYSADVSGYFGALLLLLFYAMGYFSLRRGMEKGGSFFSMADVNLLFTAPVHSTPVLLYGILRQMVMTLVGSLVILYQAGNLRNAFGLDSRGLLMMVLGYFMFTIIIVALNICLYSFTSEKPGRRKIAQRILDVLVAGLAIFFLVYWLGSPTLDRAVAFLAMPGFQYVPVLGWSVAFILRALDYNAWAFLYLGLNALVFVGALLLMAQAGTGFYEDVLLSTEQAFTAAEERKSGGRPETSRPRGKLRGEGGIGRGWGASVFFFRQMVEQSRKGRLFADGMTLLHLFLGVAAALFLRTQPMLAPFAPFALVVAGAYLALLLTMRSPWQQELTHPYVFLVPEKPLRKLIAITLFAPVKAVLDGLCMAVPLLFVLSGQDIVPVALFPLGYASMQAVYTGASLLARRIAGGKSRIVTGFVSVISNLLLILPGIVGFFLLLDILGPGLAFVVMIGWNALCFVLMLLLCRDLLHEMEA